VIANPGSEESRVRVTTLGAEEDDGSSALFAVPAGSQVVRQVPASERASATFVEVFDHWVSAAWVVEAADPEHGLGVEPCASGPSERWYTIDSSTNRGESAFLIVMNPFDALAVVDVVVFREGEPPVRDPDWTGLEIRPRRSIALDLGDQAAEEDPVGAFVEAKLGRVAVSSLGLSEVGGVRSSLGTVEPGTSVVFPVAGTAATTMTVLVPGSEPVLLDGELWSAEPPEAAGGLVATEQQGPSPELYPVVVAGPSSIDVSAEGGEFVAALRAAGEGADDASTGGTADAASTWVVPPTVSGQPSFPAIVLVNPGSTDVEVTLLQITGEGPGATRSIVVAAGRVAQVPLAFLQAAPKASVLVQASGPVVALGASTSSGVQGISLYALSLGVPVPQDVPVEP
jgi:hypothetical protein